MNSGDVVEIRRERHQGTPLKDLAKKYGVTMGHISRIASGESYAGYGGPLTESPSERTHCVHGHEYTPENIIVKHGRRNCRRCKNELERVRRKTKRAEAA